MTKSRTTVHIRVKQVGSDTTCERSPGDVIKWMDSQGWLCHRMSHLHGIKGRRFIDWDLVQPAKDGCIAIVFADASKALLCKLTWGGS